ncbi:hypothetical protein V5T82_16100 [Magnetovibrio sp. PR-2]|uniref:hypothetical protein n=1 Tax=Magnetovibrio sp. PR-2 TaxID=3120356 RepID=UPI002FCE5481
MTDAPTPPDDAPDAGEAPSSPQDDNKIPEVIEFNHPFFRSIEKTGFKVLEDTNETVMTMILDDGEVTLKLGGIKTELKLSDDDPDAKMLDYIAKGLEFVRELHIGDKMPTELTTGRASWEITELHKAVAHNRVTMQLVSWVSGDEHLITDPTELEQVVNDPTTKTKINEAFSKAAKALKIGEDRREDVIALISNLAEELAYIEALRDAYHDVEHIITSVLRLEQKYKSEQSVMDTIQPIKRLLKIANDSFQMNFLELDAQTGEILSALSNIAQVTRFIREHRDDLHRRLWAWEEIAGDWRDHDVKRSRKSEQLLEELYHFLAQRFLPRKEWELYSKALENTKKRATEVIW